MLPNSAASPQVRIDGQVGIEQLRLAFTQSGARGFGAGIAIALQLHERFVHRVGGVGIADLGLDHHQGQAVHEQHDVGDDEAFARSPAYRRETG